MLKRFINRSLLLGATLGLVLLPVGGIAYAEAPHTITGHITFSDGSHATQGYVTIMNQSGGETISDSADIASDGSYSIVATSETYTSFSVGIDRAQNLTNMNFQAPGFTVTADAVHDFVIPVHTLSVTAIGQDSNPIPNTLVSTTSRWWEDQTPIVHTVDGVATTQAVYGTHDSLNAYTNAQGVAHMKVIDGFVYQPPCVYYGGPDGVDNSFCASQAVGPISSNVALTVSEEAPELPPAAPTGLTTATSLTKAPVLSWNTVPDIDHYDVLRNGVVVGSTASTAFTDTTAPDGVHGYTVKAVRESGLASDASNSVSVTVDNTAPVVSITAPSANTIVSGTVTVTGAITELHPLRYYIGISNAAGQTVAAYAVNNPTGNTISYDWNTTALANGKYTISLSAIDKLNNKTAVSTQSIKVTVQN